MRVLLINKFHYDRDGATRAYFDMAKILEEHGHEVAFFSMHHPKNLPTYWSKYFVDEVDYNSKNISLSNKILMAVNLIYNFSAKKKLEALIMEFKPDIAHLHVVYHQLSPSIIYALKKHNIPTVMTLHDYKLVSPAYNLFVQGKIWEKDKPDKFYHCLLDKCVKNSYAKSLVCVVEAYLHKWLKTYDNVDAYISPSRFLINKFKEYNFRKPIFHLPNPILDFPEKEKYISDNDYILFFGRLSQEKGIMKLTKAWTKEMPLLKIAGSGPLESEIRRLIADSGSNNIELVGYRIGNELLNLKKQASLVVTPSLCYENASYSVIEAQAMSKVVIAIRLGGFIELIEDQLDGFLADDMQSLVAIIKRMIYNKEKLRAMGEKARTKVMAKNNSAVFYQDLISIYNNLV